MPAGLLTIAVFRAVRPLAEPARRSAPDRSAPGSRSPIGQQHVATLLATLLALCPAGAGCRRAEPAAENYATAAKGGRAPSAAPGTPPNVVWLSIESLRADHVGCYGYERDTTPELDALAKEATVFTRADAVTSWTLTSHASMFTGLYPAAHGVIRPKDRLANDHLTIAEVLRDAGYQTAAVVSGPYLASPYNLQQGFIYVDESAIQHMSGASADVTNPDLEKALFTYLREKRDVDRPFLLFAYYWDTHSEFIPPPPFDTQFVPPGAKEIKNVQYMPAFELGKHISPAQLSWLIAQYDGEIRCTDGYIGRLFALLKELGLWENTAIIVTADHGEEFYEHGRNSHKNTLYVESVHVPLIIKWPSALARAPSRDDRLVSLVDLYPTILEVTGTNANTPQSGRSLLAAPEAERTTLLELETSWSFRRKSTNEKWQERKAWTALRDGRFKVVHVVPLEDRPGAALEARWELYDLAADPGELHPLAYTSETWIEVFGALQGKLAEVQDALAIVARRFEPGGSARLTPEEEQRLRSLGYLP